MKRALRKSGTQMIVGLLLTVIFAAIVYRLEIREISAAQDAIADDQFRKIQERFTIASSEVDAASAFIVQANPAVGLFDDFLGRLALSGSRRVPWLLVRLADSADAGMLEAELRQQFGDPAFSLERLPKTRIVAPVVMTYGDVSSLVRGRDLRSIAGFGRILEGTDSAASLKPRTMLIGAGAGDAPLPHAVFIARTLPGAASLPAEIHRAGLLLRGIDMDTLRVAAGLAPQQMLQIAEVVAGETRLLLESGSTDDGPKGAIEDTVEVSGHTILISMSAPPQTQHPRLWLLALITGLLGTGLYATYRAGQMIRAEATSLNSALVTTEQALADTRRREIAFFENSGTGNCETDYRTGKLLRVNDSLCAMLGYSRDELIGRTFVEITHADDVALSKESLLDAEGKPREAVQFEKRYIRKDGSVMWGLVNGKLYKTAAGKPVSYVTVIVDIDERKRDENVKAMLLRELAHRVRNTVQLTASLARQTMRSARSVKDYDAKFQKRLAALTAAQDLLFDTEWKYASLDRLAERTIRPFLPDQAEPGRIAIDLPKTALPVQQAQTLAIAIHELSGNSAQYGALGHGGQVTFTGEISPASEGGDQQLYLKWSENVPKRVRRGRRTGFGMTMLTTAMPDQFDGRSSVTWTAKGLVYEAWLKIPSEG